MAEFLICVDPGLSTGLALLEVSENMQAVVADFIEVNGAPAPINKTLFFYKSLANNLRLNRPSKVTVVMEDWDSRDQEFTPDARHACYPAGMVLMWAYQEGVNVVMQRPFIRTGIPDDVKTLKPLGYWIPGSKSNKKGLAGHARQAMRHGLAYAKSELHHQPTIEHLFPRTV